MIVYVVTAECGDYYCGCTDGGHVIGVYTTLELAESAAEHSKQMLHGYAGKEPSHKSFPWGQRIHMERLDDLPPLAESR